jgi:hypothetical protein
MTSRLRHPESLTFGQTSYKERVGCRVCGRTLLLGERSVGFFTISGEGPYDVCELCVPRAARFGLRPQASTADEVAAARRTHVVADATAWIRAIVGGRARTKTTVAAADRRLRRAAREVAPTTAHGSAAVAVAQSSGKEGRRQRRRTAAPLDPAALGAVPVGSAAIPIALAAFNQSPHARTLAGLFRTLGAPRASVAPRSATDREVILTVAWEIVWYQFRIMPDGIEQHRGQYLSELQPRWQQWNCVVATDGTVREAGEFSALGGQADDQDNVTPEAPNR